MRGLLLETWSVFTQYLSRLDEGADKRSGHTRWCGRSYDRGAFPDVSKIPHDSYAELIMLLGCVGRRGELPLAGPRRPENRHAPGHASPIAAVAGRCQNPHPAGARGSGE